MGKKPIKRVGVGMVGTGWAGTMHANAYRQLGEACRLQTVCSLDDDLAAFAARYGFAHTCRFYEELLSDPAVDVVDIVTPPITHMPFILQALAAGKHVICEKPVTGYFGREGDPLPIGSLAKAHMRSEVEEDLSVIERELQRSGKRFFYAENWIYSPSIQRACELLERKKTKILSLHGLTGHKGSHAAHASRWDINGGGALIRQGTHPVAAALYLKGREAEARGESYGIRSVFCDASAITKTLSPEACGYVEARPVDVEDWAHVVITFLDGTKASVTAGDVFIGGILNRLDIYGSDTTMSCRMTPNNLLDAYFADDKGIEKERIMEKNERNDGLHHVLVCEELIRGYYGEVQDFITCLQTGKLACSDFALAKETIQVVYAAYLSAEEGRSVSF